jgi:hypothetical protein
MSELHCRDCECALTGKTDTYGDVGEELCQWCYLAQIEQYEYDIEKPIECIVCHEQSAYDKTPAGYPGLFHCASCRAWWDVTIGKAWRYNLLGEDVTP